MTALYIVAGIAALFFLLAMIRITVVIRLEDALLLTVRVLGVSIPIAPKREAPPSLKRFRIKAFRHFRKKEQKRYEKKKRAERSAQTEKKTKFREEAPKRSLKENVAYGVDLVRYVVSRALTRFGRYLRIDVYRIEITVGGAEPDKLAVTYGAVCQSVSYLQALLDRHLQVRYPGKDKTVLAVTADYLAERTSACLHLALSIRVWQVVAVVLTALFGYLRMPRHEPKAKPEDPSSDSDPTGGHAASGNSAHSKTSQEPATSGREV